MLSERSQGGSSVEWTGQASLQDGARPKTREPKRSDVCMTLPQSYLVITGAV
jgi:hypothetical protein